MKKLLWLFLLLGGAYGQGFFYSLPQPYPNTTITVCPLGAVRPCPSPSSIFNDSALTSPVVNPSNIGPGGQFGFFAASGQYTVQMGSPTNQTFNISLGGGGGGGGASTFPVTGATAKLTQTVANQVSVDKIGSAAATGDGFLKATVLFGPFGQSVSFDGADHVFVSNLAGDISYQQGPGVGPAGEDGINLQVDTAGQVISLTAGGSANGVELDSTANLHAVGVGSFTVSLPNGDVNTPEIKFISQPGAGLFYDPATGQGAWTDSAGLGTPLWGFNTTTNDAAGVGSLYVSDLSGFLGFSSAANGVCTVCLGDVSGVLTSKNGNAGGAFAPFAASKYNTTSACTTPIGTSANPSLVACGSASAGSFSCSTAASTGTCVISSTAITANSAILINPSSAEGAQIGVTCNTAPTLVPTILLKTKTAGSATINMPTITVNPECFTMLVVN